MICTSSSSENKRGFPLGSGDRVPHGAAPALQPGLRVQKASGCRRRSLTGHLLLPGRRSHPAREGRSQSWLLTSRRYRPCGGAEARKPVILQSYNLSQKSREKRKLRAGVWPRAQCREPPQVVATAHTSRGSSRWALLSSHFHLSFLARPPVPARTFKKKKKKKRRWNASV